MVRSFAALLGAAAAMVVTVIAGTALAAGLLAGPGGSVTAPYLTANLLLSFGAAALGGWVAARLAPRRPLLHAAALATVILLLSLPGQGGAGPGQPVWYPGAITLIGITGVACGAVSAGRGAAGAAHGRRAV